ncbi:MAG: ABC transporter permease [Chloroflexi bacterium]|nr:ABC transporter permease [Chloroflexota bacterium]
MGAFIVRRLLHTLPLLLVISVAVFAVISLPPGDYLSVYIAQLEAQGNMTARQEVAGLRERYGLDKPVYVQYWKWISRFVQGDMGQSFDYNLPVAQMIGQNILLTVVLSLLTMAVSWLVAIPIGVYSATHQYSIGDQVLTVLSFVGLATPNFLLALILLVVSVYLFNTSIGGLYSPGMDEAPWGLVKLWDLAKHLWLPVFLVGMGSTGSLVRIMRGNLLDVLGQQYVMSARGRGLRESVVVWKHAVRMAINPLVSMLGMSFPNIISGSIIVAIVLNLPVTGPMLYRALRTQDMYLAGSYLMLLSVMLIVGNFLADLALAWVDPRITYE